jgi:rod shape-determining protein MreC
MRNLLDFLSKYSFFFLFLILELICFILIYNNNYYQRSRIISTTNGLTGNVSAAFHDISSYLSLKEANQQLLEENAQLRSKAVASYISSPDSLKPMIADTHFNYIGAKVISNSVQKRNNYFMMDKGSKDGVSTDMGVITSNGIVGIIIDVSRNFCSGISILHKDTRISGRIKKNSHLVNVSWKGINYRLGTLEDIPTHVNLQKGDTIITSGNSHIFPEGILIGTVDSVSDTDQLFKTATVKFSVDYNRLYYGYIILYSEKKELEELSPLN